jgi:antitoxin HicB
VEELEVANRSKNPHVGSNFEDFLAEEGRLEQSTALAVKRVLAWELELAMKAGNVSQAELARRMKTSRAVVHRLLDATDPAVTLTTISRAATALGRSMRVELSG